MYLFVDSAECGELRIAMAIWPQKNCRLPWYHWLVLPRKILTINFLHWVTNSLETPQLPSDIAYSTKYEIVFLFPSDSLLTILTSSSYTLSHRRLATTRHQTTLLFPRPKMPVATPQIIASGANTGPIPQVSSWIRWIAETVHLANDFYLDNLCWDHEM